MSNLSEEEKEKKIIKKLHGKIFSENLTGKYYERTWIEGSELIELSQLIEKQQKEIDNLKEQLFAEVSLNDTKKN